MSLDAAMNGLQILGFAAMVIIAVRIGRRVS